MKTGRASLVTSCEGHDGRLSWSARLQLSTICKDRKTEKNTHFNTKTKGTESLKQSLKRTHSYVHAQSPKCFTFTFDTYVIELVSVSYRVLRAHYWNQSVPLILAPLQAGRLPWCCGPGWQAGAPLLAPRLLSAGPRSLWRTASWRIPGLAPVDCGLLGTGVGYRAGCPPNLWWGRQWRCMFSYRWYMTWRKLGFNPRFCTRLFFLKSSQFAIKHYNQIAL